MRLLSVTAAAALCLTVACSRSAPRAESRSTAPSTLATTSTTTTSVPATTPPSSCADAPLTAAAGASATVLGTIDLGTSGTIGFVAAGTGAAADVVDVYVHGPCGWARQLQLPIGGTVTHLDGARCADGALTVLQARSDDGVNYTTSDQRYTVTSGPALVPDGQPTTGSLPASDPALSEYGSLDCPGVSPPS